MRFLLALFLLVGMLSCNEGEKIPDVSNIKINLKTERFDKDIFNNGAQQSAESLNALWGKYPRFLNLFIDTVLNADAGWPKDTVVNYVNTFLSTYRSVYDSSKLMYNDFARYEEEIRNGLQFVKFYFPAYTLPAKVITYIGPLDGYGDMITPDGLIVGLHHHLGSNFSLYNTDLVARTYPSYISARFEPATISVNAMRNIIDDLFPERLEDKTLVVQMVEKGKRLYLLTKLQPRKDDHLLIGYTQKQWKESLAHEREIWDLFVQNNLLQTTEINVIKNYIGESPKTQELGESSPGNIGSFAGWQIVKKFMSKNPDVSPEALMKMDPEKIYSMSKYKP